MFVRNKIYDHCFPSEPIVRSCGGIRYYEHGGETYTSVTSVLAATADKMALEAWRKRVGDREADLLSERATERGQLLHRSIDRYILEDVVVLQSNFIETNRFWQVANVLNARVSEVYATEKFLYDQELGVAGRTDLFACFGSFPAIIDYKSTTHFVEEYWIGDYFLQVSAYAKMIAKFTDIDIRKMLGVVIVASSGGQSAQVFVKRPIDFIDEWEERVYRNSLLPFTQPNSLKQY